MATLAEAQAYLEALKAAYTAVIAGQEYTIQTGGNTRRLKRNDIGVIRAEMAYWEEQVSQIQAGTRGIPIKFGVIGN